MSARAVAALVALGLAGFACGGGDDASDAAGDPRVELLVTSCASGDFNACDELAAEPAATEESRRFGATCGDQRQQPGGSCLDLLGTPTTIQPTAEPGCLGVGSRGDAVRDLQQRLNAAGAEPPLVVDGEYGPRTAAAVQAQLGQDTFCESDSQSIEQQQAAYVEVPDVRREDTSTAAAALEAMSVEVTSSTRCSDIVAPGAVVAMQYQREDGRTLTLFDAEVPVASETLRIPPGAAVDLVVSGGPCGTTTTTSAP